MISVAIFVVLSFGVEVRPGQIYSTEMPIKYSQNHSLPFRGINLEARQAYELRVSWPATAPIKNYFIFNASVEISDEKAVFIPQSEEIDGIVVIEGCGVSSDLDAVYLVPLNISLEKQYYGLTIHVWRLIFHLLLILIVTVVGVLSIFPKPEGVL
jgi:hypothetical protein